MPFRQMPTLKLKQSESQCHKATVTKPPDLHLGRAPHLLQRLQGSFDVLVTATLNPPSRGTMRLRRSRSPPRCDQALITLPSGMACQVSLRRESWAPETMVPHLLGAAAAAGSASLGAPAAGATTPPPSDLFPDECARPMSEQNRPSPLVLRCRALSIPLQHPVHTRRKSTGADKDHLLEVAVQAFVDAQESHFHWCEAHFGIAHPPMRSRDTPQLPQGRFERRRSRSRGSAEHPRSLRWRHALRPASSHLKC